MNTCPQGFICVNNFHIIYVTIISIMILYGFRNKYYEDVYSKLYLNKLDQIKNSNLQPNLQPNLNTYRDLAVINDPLVPPLQRNYNVPNIKLMPINIETRESGGDFQQIGVLHKKDNVDKTFDKPGNNDETVILGLYGKQTYKGSNRWLYYVISEKNSIKIPLKIEDIDCSTDNRGCKELMEGESVNIGQYNGEFQVQIYKFDSPRYIPYV